MGHFVFPLANALRYRTELEAERKAELRRKQAELEFLLEALEDLARRHASLHAQHEAAGATGEKRQHLLRCRAAMNYTWIEMLKLHGRIQSCRAKVRAAQSALARASQDVRDLTLARERALQGRRAIPAEGGLSPEKVRKIAGGGRLAGSASD